MSYTKPYSLNNVPGGDTVRSAIVDKVDGNITRIFSDLNTHEALSEIHGATGAIVGTTNIQTLTNKTLTSPTINTPTITGGTLSGVTGSLTTPTIASFVNAQHTHLSAAMGGQLTTYAIYVSATNKLIGRSSSGAGTAEEIDCTAVGFAWLSLSSGAQMRSYLSLGAMATQEASAVAITGGTMSGVTLSSCTISSLSTPLPVASGGTGVSAIYAFLANNSSTLSPGTGTNRLDFDTAQYDTGSGLLSGYKYTTYKAGKWLFCVNIATQATGELRLMLYKNGARYIDFPTNYPSESTFSSNHFMGGSVIIQCAANDYFEVYLYQSAANNIQGGSYLPSNWSGAWLAP